VDAPGEAKPNLYVLNELIERLGGEEHEAHKMTSREHIDWMLKNSKYPGGLSELEEKRWLDCQPDFEEAHYINGFGYEDGKFRFKPDWAKVPAPNNGPMGPWQNMPALPDHWDVNELPTQDHPLRLVTSPSRSFLNSTFNQTPSSVKKEGRPTAMLHAQDAAALGVEEGDKIILSNHRGEVILHAAVGDRPQKGTVVAEGIWPNAAHEGGNGINTLTSADQTAPFGGAAFHDIHIAVRKA
ncbi:molybdopterin dinucleotide binding domain-containing protein, partial [Pseudovibrio sp. JE062]|uniref:molybdopterin dinucleotide binding domain-containing protein n=1 Tax=Pseudovibrio sp. JE062 TaxID=439495 RepID=UPI00055A070A